MKPGQVAIGAPERQHVVEVDLVERAAHGDQGAYEQLVTTRADRIFRIARAILGNEPDARDATQDAFVAAWRDLPRLREPGAFDAWLNRICVNACHTRLRGRRRVHEVSLEEAPDRVSDVAALPDHLSDSDLLARAFRRLDPDHRTILVLRHLDDQTVDAIASTLGIPAGTAKSRLFRARNALERALELEGQARR